MGAAGSAEVEEEAAAAASLACSAAVPPPPSLLLLLLLSGEWGGKRLAICGAEADWVRPRRGAGGGRPEAEASEKKSPESCAEAVRRGSCLIGEICGGGGWPLFEGEEEE